MCRQNSCKFETPKDASHPRRRNFSRTNSEIRKNNNDKQKCQTKCVYSQYLPQSDTVRGRGISQIAR